MSSITTLAKQTQRIVAETIEKARALLDKLWANIIEKEREESRLERPPPLEQFLADTIHDFAEINYHIINFKTASETEVSLQKYSYVPEKAD